MIQKFKKILPLALRIAIPVGVILLIFTFIFRGGTITSQSMEPTINTGAGILINKLAYTRRAVKRGDVIVFNDEGVDTVKRVVGLPGEKIRFMDGLVIIDDKVYEEDYIPKKTETNTNEKFKVPKGSYFVLGDNREDSFDSRYMAEPYVKKKNIIGKVVFTFGKGTTGILPTIKSSKQ